MSKPAAVETVTAESLPGVRVVPLRSHPDQRGRFVETFRQEWFPGLPPMVQGNCSESYAGVLRGLHFHRKQADYWVVLRGRVLAALADLRPGSPTEGRVATVLLEDRNVGLYIPPGVAHGYLALTDATLTYLVDQYYDNSDEFGVAWDDPDLAIPWGIPEPVLSERDQSNPRVAQLDPEQRVAFSDPGRTSARG